MRTLAILLLALSPGALLADVVQLRGGGTVTGVIVERSATEVKVDIGAGRMTVKMTDVVGIVEGPSGLSDYRRRAAALAPGDVDGWRALGRWAAEQGLRAQAQEAYTRVLAVAPADPEANQGMGRVLWNGTWMSEEDSYRAQGLVELNGEWMTTDERQRTVQEEAARQASERQAMDAHMAEVNASHAAKEAADAEYWAKASTPSVTGLVGGSGLVYWDTGIGPQIMPDPPGGVWP